MGILKKRRITVVAVATAALLVVGAGVAVAAVTTKSGTSVTRVAVLTQNAATTHAGAAFATLGTSYIYATAGSFIVTTFSAESACYNGVGYCSARILIDGLEAEPVAGTDFAFDSTDANRETSQSWESHSMQRTRSVTVSQVHTVVVQVAEVGAGIISRYDDWTLSSWAVTP